MTLTIEHDPNVHCARFTLELSMTATFELAFRIPWWTEKAALSIGGVPIDAAPNEQGFVVVCRDWVDGDEICLELQRSIHTYPLHGSEMVAFMNGPIVLAGLCDGEIALHSDRLVQDNEREWANWQQTFKTKGEPKNLRFIPLYKIGYEPYTVYFELHKHN